MSKPLRYFPFYIEEFLTAVDDFTAEEIGAYLLLLIHQYRVGEIPGDAKNLKRICKISFKKISKILQKFEKKISKNGEIFYQNMKVVEVRETALKVSVSRRKAINTRWQKPDTNVHTNEYTNEYTNVILYKEINSNIDITEIKDNKRDLKQTDACGNSHSLFSHQNFFTLQSFESFCENYLFSAHWEQLCMKNGISTPLEQNKWFIEAKNDIICSGEFETYKNESDAKRHLYYKIKNLINKKQKNEQSKSNFSADSGKKPNPTDRFRTKSDQPVIPFKSFTNDDAG